jgi:glyoxylate/hydroxypyruvate reductase A
LKIVLYCEPDHAAWIGALRNALPEAQVERWSAALGPQADYAVVWKPSPEVLPGLARVRAVFNLGAGVDAIPDPDRIPPAVPLVRLDDAGMAEQMIEYVAHAALRCFREFDVYAEQQRDGLWRPRHRASKKGFIVGVLGAGILGSAVAKSLGMLGFSVRVWSRTHKQITDIECFAGSDAIHPFLARTRFLVCLLPLTSETRNLLNREKLSRLPRGAYLVNVARGAVVVEHDLLAILDEGHLAGAMLDVFGDEPLPRDHPFWHHPRVVVTPHISAVTQVQESVDQIADKIRRLEAGLDITGIVDRRHGY